MPCSRLTAALALVLAPAAAAGELSVVSTSPALNALGVGPAVDIIVDFSMALDPGTLGAFGAFGTVTGPVGGTLALENGGTRLRFDPDEPFAAGEPVIVGIASTLRAADSSPFAAGGHAFEFRTASAPASMDFTQIDHFSVKAFPGEPVRVYGGQATDVDGDRSPDLVLVNEDSSDVRVFPNRGDGSGLFDPMLQPTSDVGFVPSPSAAADVDLDGRTDAVTVNVGGDSISVLLGQGDGTYAPHAEYDVGDDPRGLAVVDANGDGYPDVVVANAGSSDMAILLNDGAGDPGAFGAATFFEGGGSAEFALAGGDLNEDGVYDLVVGTINSERVIVHLGNGDGTFSQSDSVNGVGRTWMLVLGDVNGDGHVDVATANSSSASGTILLGDGTGQLGAPDVVPASPFVTATDLGDLDGDGDLDWVLSCYGGGEWRCYRNDGAGNFAFDQEFDADSNPGCSLIVDFDGDLDMDLVLIDEVADFVTLLRNEECPVIGTRFCSPAVPNSSGQPGTLTVRGSTVVSDDCLVLVASDLPAGSNIGYFLMGTGTNTFVPPGSSGPICIAPGLKRYLPPVNNTSGGGFTRVVGTSGPVSGNITPGSTWSFQAWHRDGMAPSNLTDAVSVAFQ